MSAVQIRSHARLSTFNVSCLKLAFPFHRRGHKNVRKMLLGDLAGSVILFVFLIF